jgi:hypothetical protein
MGSIKYDDDDDDDDDHIKARCKIVEKIMGNITYDMCDHPYVTNIVPIVAPFTCRESKWKLTHKWGTLVIIITRVSKMGGLG